MPFAIPILSVPKDSAGKPPLWWRLPWWHDIVQGWIDSYNTIRLNSGCKEQDDCATAPATLRAQAEKVLTEMPAWACRQLPLDVYTLACNVSSELGTGSAEEQVTIVQTALNRTVYEKSANVTANLIGAAKNTYGAQGRNANCWRNASTRKDPTLAHCLLAHFVYFGRQWGAVPDIADGATQYFDKWSFSGGRDDWMDTYQDWCMAGGDYLTWVGLIPGVRPFRLCLVKHRYELRPVQDEAALNRERAQVRKTIYDAGFKAVQRKTSTPPPWAGVVEAGTAKMLAMLMSVPSSIERMLGEAGSVTEGEGGDRGVKAALLVAGLSSAAVGISAAVLGRRK